MALENINTLRRVRSFRKMLAKPMGSPRIREMLGDLSAQLYPGTSDKRLVGVNSLTSSLPTITQLNEDTLPSLQHFISDIDTFVKAFSAIQREVPVRHTRPEFILNNIGLILKDRTITNLVIKYCDCKIPTEMYYHLFKTDPPRFSAAFTFKFVIIVAAATISIQITNYKLQLKMLALLSRVKKIQEKIDQGIQKTEISLLDKMIALLSQIKHSLEKGRNKSS